MNKSLERLVAEARRRRAQYLNQIITRIVGDRGGCRIIDLGGEAHYWQSLGLEDLLEQNVHVTLVNTKLEPVDHPAFTSVVGDACDIPEFLDGSFDLAHSNSTIEHVGEWSRMEAFASEMQRLAPNYYVQTPYFWFPIEPHFLALGFHWMPEAVRVRSLMKRAHGHHRRAATVEAAVETIRSARLLDQTQFRALFPHSEFRTERFGGLVKSLIAVRLAP
jgi:hypothetical protein